MCLRALALLCLLMASVGAWAADYVIKSGTHILSLTSGNLTDVSSFVPNTCIWTGSSGSNLTNNSIRLSYSGTWPNGLNTGGNVNWTIDGNRLYYAGRLSNYGVNYNNGWTITSNNTSNVIYEISREYISGGITDFTISGNSTITAIGNYNYTHTNAIQNVACTTYTFDGTTYYSTNDAQAASTTNPATEITTGYVWSLSDNPYAIVNASTGRITVNSLPAGEVDLTLTCTLNGTKTATMTVTLSSIVSVDAGYVFYSGGNNGEYLANGTAGTSNFDPQTCIWTRGSDGSFTNGTYYLRDNNTFLSYYGNRSTTVTLGGTENGTTGQTLRFASNGRYLYYNSGTWSRNQNNASNVVFSVRKKTGAESSTAPTVSGDATIATLGNNSSYAHTDAAYTMGYNDYIFYDGAHHYWKSDDSEAIAGNTKPTAESFTYTWSLSGNAAGHATVNASTGVITYSSYFDDDTDVTLTLTATSANKTFTVDKTIRFQSPKNDPTGISATDMTLNVGEQKTITPTLTPNPCYTKLNFTSANTDIATVNATTGEVTGVAGGQTTVTIKAYKYSAPTQFVSTTITVTVMEKVETPTIEFAPIDAGETATATITGPAGSRIYYTINGSDPTDESTLYENPITVNNLDVVRAIAYKDGTYFSPSDVATEQYSKHKMPTPEIDITNSQVSFTCSEDGASFYYTIDGSTPTTSSTLWNGTPFTPSAAECTIKVIAVKAGSQNSDVASRPYVRGSGISGSTVYINDYEDHTWTYYAGVDSEVDDGNYNTNYVGKIYSPNPRNVKITYYGNGKLANLTTSVTGVKVGVDADANTFVYYKTIENNGGYKYTTIPNPFSVRPKIGTTYYGFVSWRVKSVTGGTITGQTVGSTINAETEITFVPTSTYTVNCTSMEVELEAVWDVAEVSTNGTFINGYNSVERNFYVVPGNANGNLPVVKTRCTYTSFYPNGTNDGTNAATMANRKTYRGNFTCTADSKVEYVILSYASGTINADANNLTIGRGCSPASGVSANQLYGMDGKTIENPKFKLRIESGRYNYMSFFGGYLDKNNDEQGTGSTISGAETNLKIMMGCDYDRVTLANDNLVLYYSMTLGKRGTFQNANRNNLHTLDLNIKSGKLGSSFFMENTDNASYLQGGAAYGHYMSQVYQQTGVGCRNIIIEGGELCTIGSGIDAHNAIAGTINATNGTNGNPTNVSNTNRLAFVVRMYGGIIHGNVYGGAAQSPSGGNRVMIVTGGQVKGWFAAGCNGTGNDGGQNYGTSWVYIGGTGRIDSEGSTKKLGYAGGGNVYAAGAGRSGTTTCGEMTYGSNLVIADNSYIERGAYGGGNYGYTLASSNIYITGGTNAGNNDGVTGSKGGVYGGANQQNGPEIKIWMTGGKMLGGVYGGCNTSGTISGNVAMKINGGQVGTSTTPANIHGGGYGQSTVVTKNVDITLGKTGAERNADGVTVWGDVYGGSALGSVNGTAETNTDHTKVTMNAGTIHGSLYGGALGQKRGVNNATSDIAADVFGPVQVTVNGGKLLPVDGVSGSGSVFGCNNVNGRPQKSVQVTVNGGEMEYIYGGGNAAPYTEVNPFKVLMTGGTVNQHVFGGGLGADALITGGTHVQIKNASTDNPTVIKGNVYGGGNGAGVTGDTEVVIGE